MEKFKYHQLKFFICLCCFWCINQLSAAQELKLKKETQAIYIRIVSEHKFKTPDIIFTKDDSLEIGKLLGNGKNAEYIVQQYVNADSKLSTFFSQEYSHIGDELPEIRKCNNKEQNKLFEAVKTLYMSKYKTQFTTDVLEKTKAIEQYFEKEGTYDLCAIIAKAAYRNKLSNEWKFLKSKKIIDIFKGQFNGEDCPFVCCENSKSDITDVYVLYSTKGTKETNDVAPRIVSICYIIKTSGDIDYYLEVSSGNKKRYATSRSTATKLVMLNTAITHYAEEQASPYNDRIKTSRKVDLGLSVCWAGYNIGASSPEEYGSYFAWGEVNPKRSFSVNNFNDYASGHLNDIGGNPNFDAATAQWGKGWKTPGRTEWDELIEKCKWTWTNYKGTAGYVIVGPNGNAIFLPANGSMDWRRRKGASVQGNYWASLKNFETANGWHQWAWGLLFYEDQKRTYNGFFVCDGRGVRAVCDY